MFAGARVKSQRVLGIFVHAVADLHPMAVFRTTVTNFSAGTSFFIY